MKRTVKPETQMALARGIRTLNPNGIDNKEREFFYFLQVFHPERGVLANRKLARERHKESEERQ